MAGAVTHSAQVGGVATGGQEVRLVSYEYGLSPTKSRFTATVSSSPLAHPVEVTQIRRVLPFGVPPSGSVLNGGTQFLQSPERIDETSLVFFYFGWPEISGGWLIRRQLRADSSIVDATPAGNTAPDFETAWIERETLAYSE